MVTNFLNITCIHISGCKTQRDTKNWLLWVASALVANAKDEKNNYQRHKGTFTPYCRFFDGTQI